MERIKSIFAIILVLAVINTITAKAFHEFFEHHDEVHECEHKAVTHFHDIEFKHQDLICGFNLLSSLSPVFTADFKQKIQFFNLAVRVEFNHLRSTLFHYHFLLRGPPSII